MNRWNIPAWLEQEVRNRDLFCVYCGVKFDNKSPIKKEKSSWEHIINDSKIITRENIVLCCVSCNSSKGKKQLIDWLSSDYCRKKGIGSKTVSKIVRNAIEKVEKDA